MRQEERVLKSLAVGIIPAILLVAAAVYIFTGRFHLLEAVELWVMCVLITANLLLLIRQAAPGDVGDRGRLAFFFLFMASSSFSIPYLPIEEGRARLILYAGVGLLTALNVVVYVARRRRRARVGREPS